MKIENMTFDQLNACFSLLTQITASMSGANDGTDVVRYLIGMERQVGAAMNKRIDEMINEREMRAL